MQNSEQKIRSSIYNLAHDFLSDNPDAIKLLKTIDEPEESNQIRRFITGLIMDHTFNIHSREQNIDSWTQSCLPIFNSLLENNSTGDIFIDYCKLLTEVAGYDDDNLEIKAKEVFNFFNLKSQELPLNVKVHINLLDELNRGCNYFNNGVGVISSSLDQSGQIHWSSIRHELMHILLKGILLPKIDFKNISDEKVPTSAEYGSDIVMTKFEENFILAANLFFIDSNVARENNLKYYYDTGFKRISEFYSLIENCFVKNHLTLDESASKFQTLLK